MASRTGSWNKAQERKRGIEMIRRAPWQYNELKQVGVDYTSLSEVKAYDERMAKIRDVIQEIENTIVLLKIGPDDLVVEFGTGTGDFALQVAEHCKKVIAIDVSAKMLEYAERNIRKRQVNNVKFYHGGFLTYEHSDAPVNFVVSQLALHHLPDFWKLIALKRINSILTAGGTLYLKDTVYSFNIDHYHQFFEQWISGTRVLAGEELAKDVETAVRDEFSTYAWIMEELLKRAGFAIHQAKYDQGFLAQYICTKVLG